jgi:integrase
MSLALIPQSQNLLALAGQVADRHAAAGAFEDYRSRLARNTRTRQDVDLALFAQFLADAGVQAGDLATDVRAWHGVTWGILQAFVKWQLARGYAIGSVNCRLATVKSYARLAFQAGVISHQDYALITTVKGYGHKDGRHIDQGRDVTRVGAKKAQPVPISAEDARSLKAQPDGPQGRRDAVLLCILLDHGLRVSELSALTVDCFNLKAGTFTFYRQKTDQTDSHRMTADTARAVRAYFTAGDAPAIGPLLRASLKSGQLAAAGMTERAIAARVQELGRKIGLDGLSPHDCRHAGATDLAARGKNVAYLQGWGGWKSSAMASRYVEKARISNDGCGDIWS